MDENKALEDKGSDLEEVRQGTPTDHENVSESRSPFLLPPLFFFLFKKLLQEEKVKIWETE